MDLELQCRTNKDCNGCRHAAYKDDLRIWPRRTVGAKLVWRNDSHWHLASPQHLLMSSAVDKFADEPWNWVHRDLQGFCELKKKKKWGRTTRGRSGGPHLKLEKLL